jgi:DNA-directed RNA polymerase beta subunit
MIKGLELHDSTLNLIERINGKIILWLDEAIVHHTEGEPGIDKANCYIQKIKIILLNTTLLRIPENLPVDISSGYFLINGEEKINLIGISNQFSGDIEVFFTTVQNEELKIQAKKIKIVETCEPFFLQIFE